MPVVIALLLGVAVAFAPALQTMKRRGWPLKTVVIVAALLVAAFTPAHPVLLMVVEAGVGLTIRRAR